MGVDVLLYVETTTTESELKRAEEYFYERSNVADLYVPPEAPEGRGWKSLAFEPATEWHPDRVVANLTCRYWGPGYERGDWPGIYGAMRLLAFLFPNLPIHYGGDSDDVAEPFTDELADEYWNHWLGPNGNDYREYMRRPFPPTSPTPEAPGRDVAGDGL